MTSKQRPDSADEQDLLVLAAAAAADHSPGLHPIDLIVGARYGFTSDQAQTILNAPYMLDRLTRYWHGHPPAEAILQLSQSSDATGKAHLKLLEHTGHVIHLRNRSQLALAASTAGMPEMLTDDHSSEAGTVVVRRVFREQGVMDIAIESANVKADATFPVVALLSLSEDGPPATHLLFLLIPTESGGPAVSHSECRLLIDPTLTSDKLILYRNPIDASELAGTNLAAVSRSVAVAKLPWKDAWRRAALATPEGHPLRAAVINGLATKA